MSRIDRIRKQIVAKVMTTDGWWEDTLPDEGSASGMLEDGQMGKHLWLQAEKRRRKTVERLFAISTQDSRDESDATTERPS